MPAIGCLHPADQLRFHRSPAQLEVHPRRLSESCLVQFFLRVQIRLLVLQDFQTPTGEQDTVQSHYPCHDPTTPQHALRAQLRRINHRSCMPLWRCTHSINKLSRRMPLHPGVPHHRQACKPPRPALTTFNCHLRHQCRVRHLCRRPLAAMRLPFSVEYIRF